MPSRRVLSCITTLPNGTLMILNGAEESVAGFGLADKSNFNAVLYDSRKPKHHRMSIMVNITIARMYHSEAMLMDDGRVLISGSDPEDGKHPQEYRLEVFKPPYLLSNKPRLSFTIENKDWINRVDYHSRSQDQQAPLSRCLAWRPALTVTRWAGASSSLMSTVTLGLPAPSPHPWVRMSHHLAVFVLYDDITSVVTWVRYWWRSGSLGRLAKCCGLQAAPGC
ncbi:copper radical oxidase [Macroventuria anomochaeta]|uniref:Copper radical oxidase n=1 Tax=Macroventuria anomochaeta TaxID=301207 RepID=A0ACB6RWK4_9PLEO|nr:copper radical oxidase [Macroventuria anomochaeta]KAF2625523.1 copper radical oxidase [Macroventuria anomochaeta]